MNLSELEPSRMSLHQAIWFGNDDRIREFIDGGRHQSTELSIASHQQGFRLMDLCGLGRATLGLDLMMPGRWE
jgi:hypothetical protein